MTVVLDSSALLAFVFDEPGAEAVEGVLSDSVLPATGLAEVLQKIRQRGGDPEEADRLIEQLGVSVADVGAADARIAAVLWASGRGLSLADRFCVALGRMLGVPVWTCDKAWAGVDDGVVVIR